MRVKQFSVTKLFGRFDHVIPLNVEDRITIIYGRNGVGKTAVLRLINGLFNLKSSELKTIPFESFQLDFDDGSFLIVKQIVEKQQGKKNNGRVNRKKYHSLELLFTDVAGKTEKTSLDYSFSDELKPTNLTLEMIEQVIPELDRVSPTTWIHILSGERLSLAEVLERFGDVFPEELTLRKYPEWLNKIKQSINTRFIESQRLLNIDRNRIKERTFRSYNSNPSYMLPSVSTYSQELAENIQAKLAQYGNLSQSLDRSFPGRVVQKEEQEFLTKAQLREKLDELEEKRNSLIGAGLLNKDDDQNFQVRDNIDDSTIRLLSVYIEDVATKLNVFSDIETKIELFKKIINRKFFYKQITINQKDGFIFTTDDDSTLSPTDLSSGEQHELIILYELLFKVKPNSLILLDEPELSLHVEWQVQFIEDLQEITKLANLDIMMATHSPDIIQDKWSLTVELAGKNK